MIASIASQHGTQAASSEAQKIARDTATAVASEISASHSQTYSQLLTELPSNEDLQALLVQAQTARRVSYLALCIAFAASLIAFFY